MSAASTSIAVNTATSSPTPANTTTTARAVSPPTNKGGPPTAPAFLDWTHLVFSRLNSQFESCSAEHIMSWALETFGSGLSLGTSFGASGIVLMDLTLRLQPDVDIFYIDTAFFFPETKELIRRLEDHYHRPFRRVSTNLSIEEQDEQYGPQLYQQDPDLCCYLRKVEPLQTALNDSTAWATALRRDQSASRTRMPAVVWNERHSVVKLSPLIRWTENDVWDYVRMHRLPYNSLHDRNYPSVGCWPCTRAVKPGEDARAGRWSSSAKTECGLHLVR
jgi:phosphoadenosine phosphosulfate reductase